MKISVSIEDELLETARNLTGVSQNSVLVRMALSALIEKESARRLALLAGKEGKSLEVPYRPRTL